MRAEQAAVIPIDEMSTPAALSRGEGRFSPRSTRAPNGRKVLYSAVEGRQLPDDRAPPVGGVQLDTAEAEESAK